METVLLIIRQLSGLPPETVLAVLFILIFLENIIPAVPGDTFLAFAAYLAGRALLPSGLTFTISVLGSLTGFVLVYWIGSHWGREYFINRNFKIFPCDKIILVDSYFDRQGGWIILINRFLPGIRFMVAMVAGFTRRQFLSTLLLSVISILAWNGLIFRLGHWLGKNWQEVAQIIADYSRLVGLLILILVIGVTCWFFKHKRICPKERSLD